MSSEPGRSWWTPPTGRTSARRTARCSRTSGPRAPWSSWPACSIRVGGSRSKPTRSSTGRRWRSESRYGCTVLDLTSAAVSRTLAEAPDPDLARVALSRVGEDPTAADQLTRPDVLPVVARLLGFSTAAADFLVRHPQEVAGLADVRARSRSELGAELREDVLRSGPRDGLRVFRRRSMLRIAARDLAGASLDDVVADISLVAECCLEEACRRSTGDGRLAVIGLGKLGGGELNYASDVDLIFVHADGGHSAQDEAERAAAALIKLLAEPTAEGIALRVDPALRPGGRGGALSRSLDATLEYYDRQSATWERQAM